MHDKSKNSRRAQEKTAKQKSRERFFWIEEMLASHYSPFVKNVATRIALHKNDGSGRCFVSYETLADEVNGWPRSVMRAIGLLKRDGWISIKPGGGAGRANEYRLLTPPKTVTGESLFRKRCRKKTVTPDDKNSDSRRQKTVTGESPQYEDNMAPKGANIIGERETSALRSHSHSGAGGLKAAAPFEELQALWQRPWPDDEREARKAFVAACQHTDPEIILVAARVWVEHFCDAPRYLPALTKWLAGNGWDKAPPKQKRTGRHRSLGDAMLEAGERRGADYAEGVFQYKH